MVVVRGWADLVRPNTRHSLGPDSPAFESEILYYTAAAERMWDLLRRLCFRADSLRDDSWVRRVDLAAPSAPNDLVAVATSDASKSVVRTIPRCSFDSEPV